VTIEVCSQAGTAAVAVGEGVHVHQPEVDPKDSSSVSKVAFLCQYRASSNAWRACVKIWVGSTPTLVSRWRTLPAHVHTSPNILGAAERED